MKIVSFIVVELNILNLTLNNNLSFKEETMETCQDCGIENETVTQTTCPFAEEIHGDIIVITVCNDCHQQRCDDI